MSILVVSQVWNTRGYSMVCINQKTLRRVTNKLQTSGYVESIENRDSTTRKYAKKILTMKTLGLGLLELIPICQISHKILCVSCNLDTQSAMQTFHVPSGCMLILLRFT